MVMRWTCATKVASDNLVAWMSKFALASSCEWLCATCRFNSDQRYGIAVRHDARCPNAQISVEVKKATRANFVSWYTTLRPKDSPTFELADSLVQILLPAVQDRYVLNSVRDEHCP